MRHALLFQQCGLAQSARLIWISTCRMSGITAFPKSQELRDIFAAAPVDRILVETDSPYLAPPPLRGRRNEPAYTAHTARRAPRLSASIYEDFAAQTTANFERLFWKVQPAVLMSDAMRVTHPWLWVLGRCAAPGRAWGACDPVRARNERAVCSVLVDGYTHSRHHTSC